MHASLSWWISSAGLAVLQWIGSRRLTGYSVKSNVCGDIDNRTSMAERIALRPRATFSSVL